MIQTVQIPVLIAGLQSKVDGSMKIVLETRELKGNEAGVLFEMRNAEAWAILAPNEIKDPKLPQEKADPALNSKTPSQRLRGVLFVLWQQKGSPGDFDGFYKEQIERVIDKIKEQLQ